MGAGEGGGAVERWGMFRPRPDCPEIHYRPRYGQRKQRGFCSPSYRGAQKPHPMEVMKAQATRLADDPAVDKKQAPHQDGDPPHGGQ
ncbi:hypothetical protein J4Q44_G00120590 [Coregonus suidteri]|uniref:Putative monooxygenase p33MONOX n=1 Tax=Coregonus suidteri TaxID=861788 RepID=A0AAN8LVQ8_9TELE